MICREKLILREISFGRKIYQIYTLVICLTGGNKNVKIASTYPYTGDHVLSSENNNYVTVEKLFVFTLVRIRNLQII